MFNTKFSFKNKNITALIVFLVFSLFPFLAAANLVPCGGPGQDPCQFCHLFVLIDNIISYFLGNIVPPIALFMIVLGGFYMIISSGNPEKFKEAKSFVTAAVIGMAIMFLALAFLYTFFNIIGIARPAGTRSWILTDWWEIICPEHVSEEDPCGDIGGFCSSVQYCYEMGRICRGGLCPVDPCCCIPPPR